MIASKLGKRRLLFSGGRRLAGRAFASGSAILAEERLPPLFWKTFDPFLFLAHHKDNYPQSAGTGDDHGAMGVARGLLEGRTLKNDFSGRDGFSMYNAETVPGFPAHPHYGFETISIVRKGWVDHFDSHGGTARFGEGDVQWMTAGSGIQHSEMFPLINSDSPNPAELFQIWLNLPQANKNAQPYFSIAWSNEQPRLVYGSPGQQSSIRLVGGSIMGLTAMTSSPESYASDAQNEVAVATIRLEPNSTIVIPPARSSHMNRTLYFFAGSGVAIDGKKLGEAPTLIRLAADKPVEIKGESADVNELLLLQGRPIGERVLQRVHFVTSSEGELAKVYAKHRQTQFGGWRWDRRDPIHPRDVRRFYEINGKRVDGPAQ